VAGGPLEGVRIVDLTAVVVGPMATQTLADYGAEVIKVETPAGDILRDLNGRAVTPRMSSKFLHLNRNKRSLVLDLKQAAGRLIRSPTDRGVVVLADSRVTSKHYGQRFLRALPTREAVLAPAKVVVDRTAAMFGG